MFKRHNIQEMKILNRGEKLRDFVFGFNDGAVTTLVVIVTLVVIGIDNFIIILAALANIFGAGIAFTLGDYISVKSQMNFIKSFSSNKKLSKHEKLEIIDIIKGFDKPEKIALTAFSAFILSGLLAILPFFILQSFNSLITSLFIVFGSVFIVGLYRSKYTHKNKIRSGIEMVIIAGLALLSAYIIGTFIGTYIDNILSVPTIVVV